MEGGVRIKGKLFLEVHTYAHIACKWRFNTAAEWLPLGCSYPSSISHLIHTHIVSSNHLHYHMNSPFPYPPLNLFPSSPPQWLMSHHSSRCPTPPPPLFHPHLSTFHCSIPPLHYPCQSNNFPPPPPPPSSLTASMTISFFCSLATPMIIFTVSKMPGSRPNPGPTTMEWRRGKKEVIDEHDSLELVWL